MTASAISTVGALLPCELLGRIRDNDTNLPGLEPTDFGLASSERPRDAITRSWSRLSDIWPSFKNAEQQHSGSNGPITTLTRNNWLLPLLDELGFAGLDAVGSLTPADDTKRYAISHEWRGRVPVHLMGWRTPIDRITPGQPGAARASPHGLVQEFLNRSEAHLWGIASNGRVLRLLRDNASLTRQAYVEFDLAAIFDGEFFADFALLWLCCHRSRFEGVTPNSCLLEQWHTEAATQGTRARERLRLGVERAIVRLGTGMLKHPANTKLRARLRSGDLTSQDLQRELLRVVYRMLFLLVAESRDLLAAPDATEEAKDCYRRFYSMQRLRDLCRKRRVGAHSDLWQGINTTIAALDIGDEPAQQAARDALGLAPLGSLLWSQTQTTDASGARIDNSHLLDAVRSLTYVHDDDARGLRPVDYQNLGTEELGSVYESLLELHAVADPDTRTFALTAAAGSERKTTGSYYTPPELISRLLDSALDPVIEQSARQPDPQQAMLRLKVLDPACGSGHFLIAAAHRIAARLASLREQAAEPSPQSSREALRDVAAHCLYGIDINPMAVELCKISLWLESNTPGRPLSFLDHHIVCGNSLLGTTPALLADGIPDTAFKPRTGDDPDHSKALRKRNRAEHRQRRQGVLSTWNPASDAGYLAEALRRIDIAPDDTATQVAAKQAAFDRLQADGQTVKAKLVADTWCAAFVAAKTRDSLAITDGTLRQLAQTPADHVKELVAVARDPNMTPDNGVLSVGDAVRTVLGLSDVYQFTHLHLAFPEVFHVPRHPDDATNAVTGWSGGFDVILGNPPWERVKLQGKEFFAQHDRTIATAPTAAARKQLIAELESANPALWVAFEAALRHAEGTSALLCHSGRFPLAGRGDVNTYTVFIELMQDAISPTGRVGAIVPTGIATDDTTKHLFGHLVDNHRLRSLYDLENRNVIFPGVHRSQKFCLLALTGTQLAAPQADFAFFALDPSDLDDTKRHFTLTPADFAMLNPNTKTCPVFRSRRDADLTLSIYRRLPVLVDETNPDGNPWNASLQTMFHMANDSGLFKARDWLEPQGYVLEGNQFVLHNRDAASEDRSGRYVPLYEGKMISMFDHRSADVVQSDTAVHRRNQPNYLNSAEKNDPCRLSQPGSWVDQHAVDENLKQEPKCSWILGYPKVTSPTNARTMAATAMPLNAVADSVMTVRSRDQHLLYASLNSFIFDYTTRQKIGGTNLNFFIVRQLAVPTPSAIGQLSKFMDPRIVELTYSAWDMAPFAEAFGYRGPPFRWDEERRSLIRAELDALMFHLYGVNREEADYIMDTFPIVKRQDEAAHEEYRTKRLILERYDAMAAAFEAVHGLLDNTPNGSNPPQDRSTLAEYSRLLAEALDANYETVLDPPPADPSQAHPESTRPAWA